MRLILLCALILVGLGTTLYQVKTGIDERQDRLHSLELRIADTKRDIAILEAEWAYLTRPERIMTLSGDLLKMTPIGQDRILPLDAIPMRIELGPTSIKKIAFTAKQSANKERSDLNNLSASNAHSIRNGIAE
ncbi:hypothetical protein AB8881_03255 [Alphaproteobacteria bacterium LSUCC0396]